MLLPKQFSPLDSQQHSTLLFLILSVSVNDTIIRVVVPPWTSHIQFNLATYTKETVNFTTNFMLWIHCKNSLRGTLFKWQFKSDLRLWRKIKKNELKSAAQEKRKKRHISCKAPIYAWRNIFSYILYNSHAFEWN